MSTYTLPLTDHVEVTISVSRSSHGFHASGYLTATHGDGSIEYFGHRKSTHYIDYCLTEVVAREAILVTENYPRLSDSWNVWEVLPGSLPECECD